MNHFDLSKPYSLEIHGDLEEYLKEHNGSSADNLFAGPEYFFKIKEMGLILTDFTTVRVNRSPIPDLLYFVNAEFMLESRGEGQYNMSAVGAKKGIYDPHKVLRKLTWSINGINI